MHPISKTTVIATLAIAAVACSSDSQDGGERLASGGGAPTTGGRGPTAGAGAGVGVTGGAGATGGADLAGGTAPTGGGNLAGGAGPAGGVAPTGGSDSTGGGGLAGGAGPTGGVAVTGGSDSTGGGEPAGGATPMGGAATGGVIATGGVGGDFALAPTTAVSFTGSDEDFNNPERGFYKYGEVVDETSFDWVYDDGYTLVYSYVRLDDYRDGPIAQSVLDDLEIGLEAARAAGVKVILRFAYNFGPYPDSEPDASKAQILAHIAQIEPYLAVHEDVIAAMQAGFIGAWGEWHTSTNGLDNTADKQEILEALLDATPASRTVHVRYPPDKEAIYGGPLTAATAFDGSFPARTGHHNDCFLSSDTDVGTYPSNEIERWKTYLESDTQFVPMGGETCALHARGECSVATAEMARLHFSYLNRDYHTDVIDGWISGGCYDAIRRSLGYRLELVQGSLPIAARPGGAFLLEVELSNVGYAAPFNPRPLEVVLTGAGGVERAAVAGVEPRRWLPTSPVVLRIQVQLPSDLAPGDYALGLALPDASASLAERPEYAIRFANTGVWEAATGVNTLGTVSIDEGAAGDARSDVMGLAATLMN